MNEAFETDERITPEEAEEISRCLERDSRRYNRAFREAEEAGI